MTAPDPSTPAAAPLAEAATPPRRDHMFQPGNPRAWKPGQSGNPRGRPKGASFVGALARQAVTPVADRAELKKIAEMIGLDASKARSIDVVAALFYTTLCRSLVRAASTNGRVDDKVVGMLQVLLKALDPTELRVSGPDGGPIPIAAVVANVQMALGMRPFGASDGMGVAGEVASTNAMGVGHDADSPVVDEVRQLTEPALDGADALDIIDPPATDGGATAAGDE